MKRGGPFTINTVWNPSTGAAATEPGLTVTGRDDGEAYTVSAGARSLTISNPDGATLLTTVEQASDGASITVTDSATTSPSWTAGSGGSTGESYQVLVTATKDSLSSSVAFTELVSGTGGIVTPPAAASESVAAGATLSDVTFSAFTDPSSRIASYSATKTNIVGSATISGTGLGPYAISGDANSEVLLIELDALDSGGNVLATAAYTGSIGTPTSGGAWVTLKDYDLTDLDTTSSLSTGTHTLTFASIADTIDVVFSRYNDTGGITATVTNGTGIVIDGGTDTTSAGTISMRPSDWLTSYTADDVQQYIYAITFALTVDLTANPGSSAFYVGVNTGNNTTHNSGDSRHFYIFANADGTNENVRIRTNTTSTGTLTTQALRTTRTVTAIVHFGEIVQLMDNNGHTIPTPDVSQGLPTYNAGSDAVGRNDDTRVYQNSSGIRAFFSCNNTGDITCSRIIVRRFE